MSTTFEPREVEQPFRMRWLRTTLQLMLRAPVRFSIAILLLGCLDAFVLRLLPNAIPGRWAARLGMLLLPLSWVVIAVLARGADNSMQNRRALTSLVRPTVWAAALAIGLGLVTLDIAIDLLFFPGTHWQDVKLLSGRLLDLTGAQAWMVMTAAGICFFPLLVLEPELSLQEVLHLSKSATEINGRKTISWLMIGMLLVGGISTMFVPAFGLTSAAWIVFVGVLNYIAYRDIFERQSLNSPQAVATVSTVAAVHATDQSAFR
jgi:hypothetical protein